MVPVKPRRTRLKPVKGNIFSTMISLTAIESISKKYSLEHVTLPDQGPDMISIKIGDRAIPLTKM